MGAEANATWLARQGRLRDRLLLHQRHAARLRALRHAARQLRRARRQADHPRRVGEGRHHARRRRTCKSAPPRRTTATATRPGSCNRRPRAGGDPIASPPSACTARPSSSIRVSKLVVVHTAVLGRRPTTAPSAAPSSSSSKPSSPSWKANDLRRQAQAPPPDPAEEQARLHAPRLRGQGQHPVRRLRPRLHQRRADPGLLGARHPAAPRRQALRHRLQLQDPRLLPRQHRTASTPSTAACPRSSPAPTWRTAS